MSDVQNATVREIQRDLRALLATANKLLTLGGSIARALGVGLATRILILSPETGMDITAFNLPADEQVAFPIQYADMFGNVETAPAGAAAPTVTSDGDGTVCGAVISPDGSTLTVSPPSPAAGKEGTVNFTIAGTLPSGGTYTHPLAVTVIAGAVAGLVIGSGVTSPAS